MEWLQSLLDSSTVPLVTAFLLGLLTAVSPCPLATNITAIGYIAKNIESRRGAFTAGLLYTLGRIIVYAGLGALLIELLREGESIYAVQKVVARYGDMIVGPALLLIGLFMLFGNRLKLPRMGLGLDGSRLKIKSGVGALLLGLLFALAFCPSSALFYFGVLIPLSASSAGGYWLPVVFAIATGLPVVVVAWLLAFSISQVGRFYRCMQLLQKWMNLIIGVLFIIVGLYYFVILWL